MVVFQTGFRQWSHYLKNLFLVSLSQSSQPLPDSGRLALLDWLTSRRKSTVLQVGVFMSCSLSSETRVNFFQVLIFHFVPIAPQWSWFNWLIKKSISTSCSTSLTLTSTIWVRSTIKPFTVHSRSSVLLLNICNIDFSLKNLGMPRTEPRAAGREARSSVPSKCVGRMRQGF